MLRAAAERLSAWTQRNVPDPFVLALGLTVIALIGGAAAMLSRGEVDVGPALAAAWFRGFTRADGFVFAFQMALVLVTGHVLAVSSPVRALLGRIARLPRSPAGAVALVAFASCALSLIHWGLGAIGGAVLAREVGRRAAVEGRAVHYPLLGAAGYVGFGVWHGGLSGSAPLKVAEVGHSLSETLGPLPLGETIFGTTNLAITGFMVVAIPLLLAALSPRAEACVAAPALEAERADGAGGALAAAVGAVPLAGLIYALLTGAVPLDLNTINAVFLFTGIALHADLGRFVAAVGEGAKGAGAILVQFPFYYAIATVMEETGLIALSSDSITSVATPTVFPPIAFVSAALINLAVPSGGGQWVVQGPLLSAAGAQLGVDPALTVMAFAYGDASTNLLQPFWALPLLGIMRLKAGDIFGYTAIVCAFQVVATILLLLWFA